MAEYIEREEFYKHFQNIITVHEAVINGSNYPVFICDHVLHEIRNFPTADVVEVVRCKDCRHFGKNKEYRDTKLPFSFCDKFHHNIMTDNDFCSYGEKRSEG